MSDLFVLLEDLLPPPTQLAPARLILTVPADNPNDPMQKVYMWRKVDTSDALECKAICLCWAEINWDKRRAANQKLNAVSSLLYVSLREKHAE